MPPSTSSVSAMRTWFGSRLASRIFRGTGRWGCEGDLWADVEPYGRSCRLAKLPVIIKPSGNPYTCGGPYFAQTVTSYTVWEEVGHMVANGLGILDDPTQPNPIEADAIRSGISLDVLQEADALFREDTGFCGAERCAGFIGWYDKGGAQHSLLYAWWYYAMQGDEMRELIEEDLDDGNDLLERKYDWLRTNIYGGVEFDDEGFPLE